MPLLSYLLCTALAFSVFTSRIAAEPEQQPGIAPRPRRPGVGYAPASIRADVKLVLVPVSVTDALDRPVTNLAKESFRVLEDGVEQTITSFAREDAPVSLGLLFDSSGSMKSRIDGSITA